MDSRIDVVGHVIPIIKSVLIITVVDGLISQSAVEFKRFEILFHSGHIWVHKNVLGKVAEHHK